MFDFHIEASVEPSSIGLGRFACISPIRAPIRTRIRFGGGRGYYANEYSPVAARNAPAERGNKFIHPPGKVNHPPRLPPDFYAADIHRARAFPIFREPIVTPLVRGHVHQPAKVQT